MELMDSFQKVDLNLDNSCKRNEKMYYDICKELNKKPNLVIEVNSGKRGGAKTLSVQEYIQQFSWDQVRFQMDKSLKVLGAKISGTQKSCDDRLKKILEELTDVKNRLSQLVKKESTSYLQKDLGDTVYEQKMN